MDQRMVECFKALGDPVRFEIFKQLRDKEVCACDFLSHLDISQPTLSFHLKKMASCGLVNVRKDGIWHRYSLNTDLVVELQSVLDLSQEVIDACNKACR